MRSLSKLLVAGVVVTLVAVGAVAGCSKSKKNPTTPLTTLSLSLPPGGSADYTFTTAGTYPYKCGIHPTIMTGNSVVVDTNSVVPAVTVEVVGVSTPGFSPSTVIIKVGGTVHWVNNTDMAHSVVDD